MSRAELIAQPLEVYLAPEGETFPGLGEDPAGDWELLGHSFPENVGEDGVTVELGQDVEEYRGSATLPVEAFRTEESVTFTVQVHDMRPETWAWLTGNDVEEDTGEKSLDLTRGPNTAKFALLARGASPYDRDGYAQFEVPRCYQSGEPEAEFSKGEPAGLELEFTALQPDEGGEIRLVAEGA